MEDSLHLRSSVLANAVIGMSSLNSNGVVIERFFSELEILANNLLLPDLERIKAQCLAENGNPDSYYMHCLDSAIAACSTNQHLI